MARNVLYVPHSTHAPHQIVQHLSVVCLTIKIGYTAMIKNRFWICALLHQVRKCKMQPGALFVFLWFLPSFVFLCVPQKTFRHICYHSFCIGGILRAMTFLALHLWPVFVVICLVPPPHVPSCPPRVWSGAGVGVGMLRGRMIPLIEKRDSKVSWFLGFKVSWFQSFKFSMIPYYQHSISGFLEDMDPI